AVLLPADARAVAGDPGAGEGHLAELAGAEVRGGAGEMRGAAPLCADLHDALVMPCRLDHAPALDDVVRDRLLDVNVLARLTGPDCGQGVPVVGGSDGHGGDVLVLEDVADVLLEARRLLLPRGDALECLGDDVLVGVAEVGDLDIVEGGETADQV